MGFNSFVMLFLAVNIATIGVEVRSGFPFLVALGYLVYMSIYLSKGAYWKVAALFGIGAAGALFYMIGIIGGLTPPPALALAWTHTLLSLLLAGGALVHLKAVQIESVRVTGADVKTKGERNAFDRGGTPPQQK